MGRSYGRWEGVTAERLVNSACLVNVIDKCELLGEGLLEFNSTWRLGSVTEPLFCPHWLRWFVVAHGLASVQHAGDTSALGWGPASRPRELREVVQWRLLVHGHCKAEEHRVRGLRVRTPRWPSACLLATRPPCSRENAASKGSAKNGLARLEQDLVSGAVVCREF